MSPIDLIPFAEHSKKLPKKVLSPENKTEPLETWKILTSHFLDFGMAFMLSSSMALVFNLSIKGLLMTRGLRSAFSEATAFKLSMALFPLILFSYFFSSYFLNNGQTYGMYILKKRMEMKSNSLRDSFSWATHSFLLCVTGGISLLAKKDVWKSFRTHDHLYTDLFIHKDYKTMDLVEKTKTDLDIEQEEKLYEAA